ncbi:MAG: excinuclease ABC subunit UvrC [Oscillospiraceae bacterium]|nr:excinuclease ABC subunit UvrC [Oscillospiraceae bacterium]
MSNVDGWILEEQNSRLPYLREKTSQLTTSPGVYLMKNAQGGIIYIGKAKNLHNRVSSYFRLGADHLPKVARMVSHVYDYDFIVTGSEYEALLLECSLIKQHKPHYNILLKDDKGYHYIKVSAEPYPRITAEKQKTDDKSLYIGPYTGGFVTKSTVEEVNTVFRLPTCTKKFPESFRKGRPCLNYHIHRCMGVCQGKISQDKYKELIEQAVSYIRSGSAASVERMTEEMEQAAENLDFERAAQLRDRIRAIQKAAESQKIIDNNFRDADVIGTADNGDDLCISVIMYRDGRLRDKQNFHFHDAAEESALDAFVPQFYHGRTDIPKVILLESEIREMDMLAEMLSAQMGRKVKLTVPQRGGGIELTRMAKENAVEYIAVHSNRTGRELLAVEALGKLLGMEHVPKYIESYDISNLASESMVAGMVVFENGRPLKKAYKRFSIKEQEGQNDYACMREVIRRRLSHLGDPNDPYFARTPDLILLDGGKGHVSAVAPIVQEMAPEIALFGMVKDSKHRTRAIATGGGEISVSGTQSAFQLLTRIQDEVHRYSVAYMHKKHKKRTFASELTQVEGIGDKLAQKLMLHFKTKDALLEATQEELHSAGISEKTAARLYAFLHGEQEEAT